MIRRNITETIYEYNEDEKLIKKTVIETHEEEDNTITTSPSWTCLNGGSSCGDIIFTETTTTGTAD